MSLFKKKDQSPYRHIGMALVPPVAFTAVPDSPPPTPIPPKKKNKRKVVISPILPAMIGANVAAKAIALAKAGNEIEHLDVSMESIQRRQSEEDFIEEDELYARITTHPKGRAPQSLPQLGAAQIHLTSDEEDVIGPSSAIAVKTVHAAEVYAVPNKNRTGRSKKRKKNTTALVTEEPVKLAQTAPRELFPSNHSTLDQQSNVPSEQDLSLRQDELEERMKLKDEEMREMIMKMMQNNSPDGKLHEESSPATLRSIHAKKATLPQENSYQHEDKDLIRDIAAMLKEQSMSGAEGVVLNQQIQEMVDENETLKDAVQRLNVELSRYQAKYGTNPDSLEGVKGLPTHGPKQKWLTDAKYLSPLFLSYDQQLETKDEIIASHVHKFSELGKQMEGILQENEILRAATKDRRAQPFITQEKWNNLKEQNSLMVEEIQVQLEQLQLMERKLKEMHSDHINEVSKLTKRLAITDADYQEAEKSRQQLKEGFSSMMEKFEKLQIESSARIPANEYSRAVAQCKSDIEELKENHEREMKEVMKNVKAAHREKSEALLQVSEVTANNKKLKGEIDALKMSQKSKEEKIERLQFDLEEVEKREIESQLHLANMVRLAEKASTERATFAAVAEQEQRTSQHALRQTMREKWEMGRMEESLKQHRLQLASHRKDATDRLREVEDTHTGQLMEYERKMTHLRKMLQQKQQALDDMATNKRQIEKQLENVWQAASSENRRIMEALHRSKIST
ncbi:centrosomal protein of 89 kDa-like isoform X1 [Clavelina lepadiformis]|uniref:centrosomal protein of 89 kDa-like isoform X1 n=1 Tax=Clavelina lepadiformis TaxID=159417 RepID=UPI004042B6B3